MRLSPMFIPNLQTENGLMRRIYIANFAIFKIYTCAKNREVSVSRNFAFLVGSAHVRSQATVHAFMHAGQYAWGYRYTFQKARVASSPEVPKVTWWKIATFLSYHLHWLTSLETSRHFRKIALRLGIFLAMFGECLCVVARQLAPKCRNFSNVAKLARQCKWPYDLIIHVFWIWNPRHVQLTHLKHSQWNESWVIWNSTTVKVIISRTLLNNDVTELCMHVFAYDTEFLN